MNDVRVLVVAGCDATSERLVVRGFHEIALLHGWNVLRYMPQWTELEARVHDWDPAAVVLGWNVQSPYPAYLRGRVLVATHGDHGECDIPHIVVNDEQVGQLAAEHLLATGLQHFATFWYTDNPFAVRRSAGFRRCITEAGGTFHQEGEFGGPSGFAPVAGHAAIIAWLKALPKPCGIFACCDHWASSLASYCRAIGSRIPEDIALIGAENDELQCEVSSPPITSIAIPWFRAGREVGELVSRGLEGGKRPAQPVVIDPIGVVARRSTDVLAIPDAEVSAAVRWIHDNAHRPISVPDILRALPVYRQRLERRFRLVLGRTIMEEVRRVRVELARRLLRASSLTVPEIAERSGFGSATMLGITFRKETHLTPTEYRRQFQSDGGPERCAD